MQPTMQSIGSHYYICEGNLYKKYREGWDDCYVFIRKMDERKEELSDTYFNQIEDDFRLLHKPLEAN